MISAVLPFVKRLFTLFTKVPRFFTKRMGNIPLPGQIPSPAGQRAEGQRILFPSFKKLSLTNLLPMGII